MSNQKYHIIQDPVYGFRRLEPIPDGKEVTRFYQSQYYNLIRKGGRAPELRRSIAGGQEADNERAWLSSTLYADILAVLEQKNKLNAKRLLDIGCGTGEFITFFKQHEWEVMGFELSSEAANIAKSKGLEVFSLSLEEFLVEYPHYSSTFSVITLLNVLEHIPNPVRFLNLIKKLLPRGGVIVIQVPNDFNELQITAKEFLNKEP